jgi:hypothetical protein
MINKRGESMSEIKFEIVKKIGVLSTSEKGWTKELNLINWNDRPTKYDLREWDPEHRIMSKGITLSNEEITELKRLLEKVE